MFSSLFKLQSYFNYYTMENKIDVKKPQILIEAFLVEVKPTFETKLGSRIGLSKISDGQGGATTTQLSGIIGGTDGVALGTAGNSVSSFLVDGTSGLGIIRNVGSRQLKVEIDANYSIINYAFFESIINFEALIIFFSNVLIQPTCLR